MRRQRWLLTLQQEVDALQMIALWAHAALQVRHPSHCALQRHTLLSLLPAWAEVRKLAAAKAQHLANSLQLAWGALQLRLLPTR